jgi:beta-lactamase regulating signal transducer with metallopeptidase domain
MAGAGGINAFFVEVTVRATALLVAGLLLALVIRRAPAATRRRLWAGTLASILLLPILVAALPRLPVPVLEPPQAPLYSPMRILEPFPMTAGHAVAPVAAAAPRSSFSWTEAFLAVYGAGVAVSLVGLLRARRRAHLSLRGARPAGSEWAAPSALDARESGEVALPSTIGSLRPVVLLPLAGRSWPEEWRRAVLAHEAAHVRGHDGLWQLAAELCRALYWFHPLVHLAARQLRVERELAADDRALAATGMAPSAYAGLLFELACVPDSPAQLGAVVPLLTPAGLKTRLVSILDGGRARSERMAAVVALAVLGLAAVTSAAAAIPASRRLSHGRGPVIARVTGAGPVAGVEVVFRLAAPFARSVEVSTDARGEVRYPAELEQSRYFDVYARRGRLAARAGVMNVPYGTKLPIELTLRPAPSLSGQVRDDQGRPVAGATVEIDEDERYAPGPIHQVLARTDGEGRWRIDGLLYGKYSLLLRAPWGVFTIAHAQVGEEDVSGVDAMIPGQWPITGYLQDESGRRLGGVRVDQSDVWVTAGSGRVSRYRLPGERHVVWDESAPDGSFRLVPRQGRLNIVAPAAQGGLLYGELERVGRHLVGVEPPIVTLARTATVAGVVRRRDGRGLTGVVVEATESMWSFPYASDARAITDAQGRFAMTGVPPRVTHLRAHTAGLPVEDLADTTVAVRAGESRQDLVLEVP